MLSHQELSESENRFKIRSLVFETESFECEVSLIQKANNKKNKQPPKFKQKKRSKKEIAKAQARAQRLERERDKAVTKIKELEELLEKLPEIFESKFTQRLAPVLERQRLLLEENSHLRALLLRSFRKPSAHPHVHKQQQARRCDLARICPCGLKVFDYDEGHKSFEIVLSSRACTEGFGMK